MTEIKVPPEELYTTEIYQAACNGWLIIKYPDNHHDSSAIINKVQAYVLRIEPFVTTHYKSLIVTLWTEICQSEELNAMLIPKSKARKCKDFDKYSVVRIIGVLRELGVYEQRSDPKFDALLEPDTHDSPYRRYLGQSFEKRSQMQALKEIIEHIRKI